MDKDDDLLLSVGITDRTSGLAAAIQARLDMISHAFQAVGEVVRLDVPQMTLFSALTKAQAFHDGAVGMIRENNPFGAFTLIRAYAENAAMFTWLLDHPGDLLWFYPQTPKDRRISVGRMMNGARKRFPDLQPVYEQLSEMAHPTATTAMSGWHLADPNSRHIRGSSAPAFKSDNDYMTACFWLVEFAEATAHLWPETWLQYFGPTPKHPVPEWRSAARQGGGGALRHNGVSMGGSSPGGHRIGTM